MPKLEMSLPTSTDPSVCVKCCDSQLKILELETKILRATKMPNNNTAMATSSSTPDNRRNTSGLHSNDSLHLDSLHAFPKLSRDVKPFSSKASKNKQAAFAIEKNTSLLAHSLLAHSTPLSISSQKVRDPDDSLALPKPNNVTRPSSNSVAGQNWLLPKNPNNNTRKRIQFAKENVTGLLAHSTLAPLPCSAPSKTDITSMTTLKTTDANTLPGKKILVVGDFTVKNLNMNNTSIHYIRDARVANVIEWIENEMPAILSQANSQANSLTKLLIHVGWNNITIRSKAKMEQDFQLLIKKCQKLTNTEVYISGPLPATFSSELFSRALDLNHWIKKKCMLTEINFLDNFDLFWQRDYLFRQDGVLNQHGAKILRDHITHGLRHPFYRPSRPLQTPGNQLTSVHTPANLSSTQRQNTAPTHQQDLLLALTACSGCRADIPSDEQSTALSPPLSTPAAHLSNLPHATPPHPSPPSVKQTTPPPCPSPPLYQTDPPPPLPISPSLRDPSLSHPLKDHQPPVKSGPPPGPLHQGPPPPPPTPPSDDIPNTNCTDIDTNSATARISPSRATPSRPPPPPQPTTFPTQTAQTMIRTVRRRRSPPHRPLRPSPS